jgi:predicted transcriptional regulator
LSAHILDTIPEDTKDNARKIFNVLSDAYNEGKIGLNMTKIRKLTGLSYSSTLNSLVALKTAKIVKMEKVGTSKIYTLSKGENINEFSRERHPKEHH